jgi:hypothetical protein
MNKYKGEFHRWIIEEWKQKGKPLVCDEEIRTDDITYMRLWEHKCGQLLIVYDIGRMGRV